MGTRGRAVVGSLLLAAALTACGNEPTRGAADEGAATASAVPTRSPEVTPVEGTSDGAASDGEGQDHEGEHGTGQDDGGHGGEGHDGEGHDGEGHDGAQPPADPPPAVPPASGGGPDVDGDGRTDTVTLLEVPDTGWSFDVRLADGRETSAPLPDDGLVHEDVAVVGAVDLDRDGADEVLVRTLRAVGGQNAVVFRLDGDGVWLVRDLEGRPWELSTSGGMTGPRSYACADGEVLTRESERQPDGSYRATTWRWTLDGHTAGPLGGARDEALAADDVSLDPSTCEV